MADGWPHRRAPLLSSLTGRGTAVQFQPPLADGTLLQGARLPIRSLNQDDMPATVESETTQHLTIHYEAGADGWVTATIEEEPGAISQGRTRDEAYLNVLDALHDLRHSPSGLERVTRRLERWIEEFVEAVRERRAAHN